MGLFDRLRRKTNSKAIFIGLDASGKSTIISFLQQGKFVEHTPTMGKSKLQMDVSGTRISLIDLGGQKDFRELWLGELSDAKCVVFVVDKANEARFKEAKSEFRKVLPMIIKKDIKLLFLANKHDLDPNPKLPMILRQFELLDLENFEILEISAKTGYGMADAFVKFFSILTGEKIRKTTFTKGISLFNSEGKPIISQYGNMADIERQAIEGGFNVAITEYCKAKPTKEDEFKIITYESENDGTFVVGQSAHYICSLLWHEKLGISLDQTKDVLKDLLTHVETVVEDYDNNDAVSFIVEHYITNIM